MVRRMTVKTITNSHRKTSNTRAKSRIPGEAKYSTPIVASSASVAAVISR